MSSITSLIRLRTAGIVSAVISFRVNSFCEEVLFREFVPGFGPPSSNDKVERQFT